MDWPAFEALGERLLVEWHGVGLGLARSRVDRVGIDVHRRERVVGKPVHRVAERARVGERSPSLRASVNASRTACVSAAAHQPSSTSAVTPARPLLDERSNLAVSSGCVSSTSVGRRPARSSTTTSVSGPSAGLTSVAKSRSSSSSSASAPAIRSLPPGNLSSSAAAACHWSPPKSVSTATKTAVEAGASARRPTLASFRSPHAAREQRERSRGEDGGGMRKAHV